MRSAVTGAAGFLGLAIVRHLLVGGDQVRGVVLPGDPQAAGLRQLDPGGDRLDIVEGDVTDIGSLAPAFRGVHRVFHTAALVHAWAPLSRFRTVNVGGMQNVARAAAEAGVERLLAVSTSDVFGIPRGDEVLDESSPVRRWGEPYADSKIEAERWLWQYRRDSGLPVTVIYPGWIYGPGDRAFLPGLAAAIRGGFMIFWARQVRLAWAYIDNIADACVLASAEPRAAGEGYLVHDGMEGPTFEEVCARIAGAIGARPPRRHVPYAAAYGAAAAVQWTWRTLGLRGTPPLLTVDVKAFGRSFRLSNEKIRALGWRPRVPTEEGMERALACLKPARE